MYTREYLENNPPRYENLTDTTSLENGVCEELTNVADELQTLVRNIQDLNENFVGRMKRQALTWEQVTKELDEVKAQIEDTMEFVLEKFF